MNINNFINALINKPILILMLIVIICLVVFLVRTAYIWIMYYVYTRSIIELLVSNSNKISVLTKYIISKAEESDNYYYGILIFDQYTFIPIEINNKNDDYVIELQNMIGQGLLQYDLYELARIKDKDQSLFQNNNSYITNSLSNYRSYDYKLKQLRGTLNLIGSELIYGLDIERDPVLIGPTLIGFWATDKENFINVYYDAIKNNLNNLIKKENNIIDFINRTTNTPDRD